MDSVRGSFPLPCLNSAALVLILCLIHCLTLVLIHCLALGLLKDKVIERL
jgi:hypothetical protein